MFLSAHLNSPLSFQGHTHFHQFLSCLVIKRYLPDRPCRIIYTPSGKYVDNFSSWATFKSTVAFGRDSYYILYCRFSGLFFEAGMRITGVVTALNDLVGPVVLSHEHTHYVNVFIDNAADGSVVLEISGMDNGATPPVDIWNQVQLIVDTAGVQANAAAITGSGAAKYGYALVGSTNKVRVRKSAAGTGPMRVTLAAGHLG
jgi:hypothetical protein